MSRNHKQTHYCADASCRGFTGFEVSWANATDIDPSWPVTDTCPHCGSGMLNEPVQYQDALDALLADLQDAGAIGQPDESLDALALLAAIQAELARQQRATRAAATGRCGRCRGTGLLTISTYIGDGFFDDNSEICPTCEGSGVHPLRGAA